nr:glutamate receptor ionotropic, NMDA 3A-like [Leptinotarsa decemlineata]
MAPYSLQSVEEGVEKLRNGTLDILIADTPILDYYRATDHGCKLQKIGETINEDTYAIGMTKGFPLKVDSFTQVGLNITAIAVAIYEWLSPFGLNPWGRQRSKNFSMSSALWVMWGLLCGHLVAFKAPKSWPNKFLINVWGGFSVIFVASYTANIAALIAGLFFHLTVSNYHDRSLLSQKVGAPRSSAAEFYVQKANQYLWQHMAPYSLQSVEEGVEKLRNGTLDILIADTPILDYYRATDHGCKLQKIGETINEDTYAIGMTKGFPLKDSVSAVIAKYSSNGYMDILQEKWYGGLPCFKLANDIAQPRPLGVKGVGGVF